MKISKDFDMESAYLYSYHNWYLQKNVTLVASFVTNRTALILKGEGFTRKITLIFNVNQIMPCNIP
jgi:hypothetical protein